MGWACERLPSAVYAACLAQAREDLSEGDARDEPGSTPESRARESREGIEERLVGLLACPADDDLDNHGEGQCCDVCGSAGLGSFMLLCEGCEGCPHMCHTFCLKGHGKIEVPEEEWLCAACSPRAGRGATGKRG